MANRYWIGTNSNTANYSLASNWSNSTNGTGGFAVLPGDDIYFTRPTDIIGFAANTNFIHANTYLQNGATAGPFNSFTTNGTFGFGSGIIYLENLSTFRIGLNNVTGIIIPNNFEVSTSGGRFNPQNTSGGSPTSTITGITTVKGNMQVSVASAGGTTQTILTFDRILWDGSGTNQPFFTRIDATGGIIIRIGNIQTTVGNLRDVVFRWIGSFSTVAEWRKYQPIGFEQDSINTNYIIDGTGGSTVRSRMIFRPQGPSSSGGLDPNASITARQIRFNMNSLNGCTGDISTGSNIISNITGRLRSNYNGIYLTGNGIPKNTFVVTDNGTSFILNNNCTASATGQSIQISWIITDKFINTISDPFSEFFQDLQAVDRVLRIENGSNLLGATWTGNSGITQLHTDFQYNVGGTTATRAAWILDFNGYSWTLGGNSQTFSLVNTTWQNTNLSGSWLKIVGTNLTIATRSGNGNNLRLWALNSCTFTKTVSGFLTLEYLKTSPGVVISRVNTDFRAIQSVSSILTTTDIGIGTVINGTLILQTDSDYSLIPSTHLTVETVRIGLWSITGYTRTITIPNNYNCTNLYLTTDGDNIIYNINTITVRYLYLLNATYTNSSINNSNANPTFNFINDSILNIESSGSIIVNSQNIAVSTTFINFNNSKIRTTTNIFSIEFYRNIGNLNVNLSDIDIDANISNIDTDDITTLSYNKPKIRLVNTSGLSLFLSNLKHPNILIDSTSTVSVSSNSSIEIDKLIIKQDSKARSISLTTNIINSIIDIINGRVLFSGYTYSNCGINLTNTDCANSDSVVLVNSSVYIKDSNNLETVNIVTDKKVKYNRNKKINNSNLKYYI